MICVIDCWNTLNLTWHRREAAALNFDIYLFKTMKIKFHLWCSSQNSRRIAFTPNSKLPWIVSDNCFQSLKNDKNDSRRCDLGSAAEYFASHSKPNRYSENKKCHRQWHCEQSFLASCTSSVYPKPNLKRSEAAYIWKICLFWSLKIKFHLWRCSLFFAKVQFRLKSKL